MRPADGPAAARPAWRNWFNLLPARTWPRWLRTAFGFGCGLVAIAVRLPMEPYLDGRLPFVFFLPAVTVAAAKGGVAASVAAVATTAAYLVLGSPVLAHFDLANGLPLALFVLSSVLVTAVAQQLRLALAHSHSLQRQQVTMLHELNHRVKNTLATVQSLARHSARAQDGPERFEARLLALSKTHDLLTRADWSSAPLREVLDSELRPYAASAGRIALDGPDVALPPRYVLTLGMTIHELATNAAKYGALSVAEGRVAVRWHTEPRGAGDPLLCLIWQETRGPPVAAPVRRGFGMRLIVTGVQRELSGEIDLGFETAGLCCRIAVPLAAREAELPIPT